jgi:hypothetical protein
MKRLLLVGVSLAAVGLVGNAHAGDASLPTKTPMGRGVAGPYKNSRASLERQVGPGSMHYYGGPKSPMWRAGAAD